MSVAIAIRDVAPIGRRETWHLASTEYQRALDLLRTLGSGDWSLSTDCDRWDARALATHMLGASEAQASPREMVRQFRLGLPLNRELNARHWVDGVNEQQIRDRIKLSSEEIIRRFAEAAPKAVRGRRFLPPPIRWVPIPMGRPIGWKPLTYLLRMGFTRDLWMHRIDLARAIGRDIVLTPDHDRRIVADVVVEWARRHGEPFRLALTGPAGSTFTQGSDGEELEIDAIEFCRILSGRGLGSGLLRHPLPL
jgi:uncharacterized protein (TIGR03083 family)